VINGTLEELWISYNSIQKFDGILTMKKLRVNFFESYFKNKIDYLGFIYK